MPKNNNRQGRIDEEFRRELSQIISFDLKNPSVTGMVSVTRVKVTPDLKFAKVSVSIFLFCSVPRKPPAVVSFFGAQMYFNEKQSLSSFILMHYYHC
mgnify:CR=1 FL=1